jgi:hypothetical protein
MKQDAKRMSVLVSQVNDHLTSMIDQMTLCPWSSSLLSDHDILSECRAVLHWGYELRAVAIPEPGMTTKKPSRATTENKLISSAEKSFQLSVSYGLELAEYHRTKETQGGWEWALMRDLLNPQASPKEFPSLNSFEIKNLTNLDKSLISKLVVSTLLHHSSAPLSLSRTVVGSILAKFIPPLDPHLHEYSSKLLSLAFQTVLNNERVESNELVFLDLLSFAFQLLGVSLSTDLPLVDYLIKVLSMVLAKVTPLNTSSDPQLVSAHCQLVRAINSFIPTAILFLSSPPSSSSHPLHSRLTLFSSTFPVVWTDCLHLWSGQVHDQMRSPDLLELLVKSDQLFGHLLDLAVTPTTVTQQDQLSNQFCQLFISLSQLPFSTSPQETPSSPVPHPFTEQWLSQLIPCLESSLEEIWNKSTNWRLFHEEAHRVLLALTALINIVIIPTPSAETVELLILSLSSQVCWSFQKRWKSKECSGQYQRIADEICNQLRRMIQDHPHPSSKKTKGGGKKESRQQLQEQIAGTSSVCQFKALLLLINWNLALRVNDDEEESTGEGGSDAYQRLGLEEIWMAFDRFKEIVRFNKTSSRLESSGLLDQVCQFYHLLGLKGCTTLQLELLQLVSVHTNKDDSLMSKYQQTLWKSSVKDLKFSFLAWCLFNGCLEEYQQARKIVVASEGECEFQSPSHLDWVTSASSFFHRLLEEKMDSPHTLDNTSFATLTMTLFKMSKSSSTLPHHRPFSTQHASWIALLYSKILFFSGHLAEALTWSKYVLSLRGTGGGGAGNGPRLGLSIDHLEVEVEAMLQLSDLYECSGAIERCFSYLAEAKVLCCSGIGLSTVLPQVFAFHCLRIWKRAGSSRYDSQLQTLATAAEFRHQSVQMRLLPFEKIQQSASSLLLGNQSQPQQQAFQYRYLGVMWTPSHALLLRAQDPRQRPLNLTRGPFFSGFSHLSSEHLQRLLSTHHLLQTEFFDLQRDARRGVVMDLLSLNSRRDELPGHRSAPGGAEADGASLHNFLSWFFVTSSCSTSLETSLEQTSLEGSELISLKPIASLIQESCRGDLTALSQVNERLQTLLTHQQFTHPLAICGLVFDHLNSRVLLTRLESSSNSSSFSFCCSFTVALETNSYQSLSRLVTDWNQLMEMNRTQLAETSDPDKVRGWKAADKKRWWLEREILDGRIERLLNEFEECLGVWRCLLTSSNTPLLLIPQSVRDSLCGWFLQFISSSSVKKCAVSVEVEGKVNELIPWLQLVLSEQAFDECDQITAVTELLTWILSHLLISQQDHEETISSADAILQRSIQLVREVRQRPTKQATGSPSCGGPVSSLDEITQRLSTLKVVDLKSELRSHGLEVSGKKGELHDRLLTHLQSSSQPSSFVDSLSESPTSAPQPHLILILDETFQALPLECLPSLRSRSCSRIPSLLLLLHSLNHVQPSPLTNETKLLTVSLQNKAKKKTRREETEESPDSSEAKVLSLSKCWYSVDPEANLMNTRETMMAFMESYIAKWRWRGYAGQRPPDDMIR